MEEEAGCSCPDGELVDDYGNCVPLDNCTCYDYQDDTDPIKQPGDVIKRGCVDW